MYFFFYLSKNTIVRFNYLTKKGDFFIMARESSKKASKKASKMKNNNSVENCN